MNLFCKLPYCNTLCLTWVHSDNDWIRIAGFILAARSVEILSQTETDQITRQALKISGTDNFHLYKAVALCLSRFCRKNKDIAAYILKEITAFSQTTSIGQHYISTEVKQEILFLTDL